MAEELDSRFDIEGIYACRNDFTEELLWKSMAYNATYMKLINDRFLNKMPASSIRQLLMGFYTESSQIHLRPLTKMQQDVARQLKILK